MKFEDYLGQQGDEKQKRVDLEEEVKNLISIISPPSLLFCIAYRSRSEKKNVIKGLLMVALACKRCRLRNCKQN